MSKFKVGHRVRCIDDGGVDALDNGSEYIVWSINSNNQWIGVEDDDRPRWHWDRFELVTPAPTEAPEPKWMTVSDFEAAYLDATDQHDAALEKRKAANIAVDKAEFDRSNTSNLLAAARIIVDGGYRILPPEQTP